VKGVQSVRLRTMTGVDIPAGLRLNKIVGWNQTEADWKRFLSASPEGCFVAECDGEVRGTVTTISFENRFAWLGMVLVDPGFRGQGIGTKLVERAIEYLERSKIPAIKLDATPQGKPLYENWGFVSEYEIERWTLRRSSADDIKKPGQGHLDSLPHDLLGPIAAADREAFGADRNFLLMSLHEDAPHLASAVGDVHMLEGYALGRQGCFADQLGPWMAVNQTSASRLLDAFLAHSSREIVIVDLLRANVFAGRLVRAAGFTCSRPLTRMYRGRNDHRGRPELLCAILGPEFG
jgi:GNAT superfamily N-acetyltransferase